MKNFTKRRIALAVAMIGYASVMNVSYAADDAAAEAPAKASDASKLERVEVVGSNIKRAVSTQATQIENYKTEDFAKKGLNSAQDVVNSLASNQSTTVAASQVGGDTGGASYANLRSLGSQYTLVLIDGRRVANQPGGNGIGASAVDLNTIPLDAIDRVEVLKDGASAIYGTDAIGGVINFITKKNFQGGTATIGYSSPTQSGGGVEKRVSLAGGLGDLDADGWNVYGTFGLTKTSELTGAQRSDVAIDRQPTFSASTWPSNYLSSDGDFWNPAAANNACRGGKNVGGQSCRENTSKFITLLPESERWTSTAKATKRVFADSELSLQLIHAEGTSQASSAPTPFGNQGIYLNESSPYYPKTNPDGSANSGALDLYGRSIDAGARVSQYRTGMTRVQSNLEGTMSGWDYKAGLGASQTESKYSLISGWLNKTLLQQYLDDGRLNPFGSNAASVWNSLKLSGEDYKATMKQYIADYKMSKEVLALPAGNLAVAFGTEIRREELEFKVNPGVSANALSSGGENSGNTSGGRTVYAFYGETLVPILKWLEADAAVRYDHYSDFGETVNPKLSLKATPIKEVMFRGSVSTGFRAPTMYDMYSPSSVTNTASKYADPLVNCAGTTAGLCDPQQRKIQLGGNRSLQAEKSFSTSIGTVVQPVKNVMASADLWTTLIRNSIGNVAEADVMANPSKYGYVANADGSLNYANAPLANLGNLRTSGVDIAAFWRIPTAKYGTFALAANSTYTRRYDYQTEKDGNYTGGVGMVNTGLTNSPVIFRWKTNTTLSWNREDWAATLGANYLSGYTDMYPNDDDSRHIVPSYLTWDGSVTYSWDKKASLTLGARNMFNRKPLYTNQDASFQTGFDARYSDILGRTLFLNLTYKM